MAPRKIKNIIYEIQKEWLNSPAEIAIKTVWINKVSPIAKGWISWQKINEILIINEIVNNKIWE